MATERLQLRAGGQDWAAIWRAMYHAEREQAEAWSAEGLINPSDYWATQAERFHAAARRVPQPDTFMRFVLPQIRPDDRVADVGAGSGRYIPTLARHCRELVAVEPSAAMRGHLEASVAEHRLDNVRVQSEPWPHTQLAAVDVIVCAHVLYSVADAAPFLQALDAAAGRACFLLLFLKHPLRSLDIFWERFRGEQRLPLPAALEAFNLCQQLGINANLQLIPATSTLGYVDAEEALVDVRWRLRFAPDAERDRAIARAIDELMIRRDDGTLAPPNLPQQTAVVWWERATPELAR
jgi:SAM-dependent methyltransferase